MSLVITGAKLRLEIDGTKVGYCTGVDVEETVEYSPVEVIDEIAVKEHVAVAYRVSVRASFVRVFNINPSTHGFGFVIQQLKNGGTAVTGVLTEGISGKSLGSIAGLKMDRRSQSIQARAMGMDDVSFVATLYLDETQQQQNAGAGAP